MKEQAHDEILQVFNNSSDKTKRAIAQVTVLYTRKYLDGKIYIQVDAAMPMSDGTRLAGYLQPPFTTDRTGSD